MTYKWARDMALQLIDQYSVAGAEVARTYNNQADYLAKIPALLDDAAVTAATGPHRIRATVRIGSLEHRTQGAWVVYTLPENCFQMCGTGLLRLDGEEGQRFHRYHLVGLNGFAVPPDIEDTAILEYWRWPVLLGSNPADDTPLDNTLTVQRALPYFAAARLVMLDNQFAYAALMNEFEGKLREGVEEQHGEWEVVEDAY